MDRNLRLGAAMILLGLAVAGCRARGTAERRPAASPPPAAKGQVNPDADVTAYDCVDGQTITAGYPDAQTAVVTYKGHAYTLKRAGSGSGARYTGYGLQWQTRGARGVITALKPGEETASGPGLECVAPGKPSDSALTRTSYRS